MSPFRSQSQRRKFYTLAEQGEISKETLKEWEKETPENIPEKARKKRRKKIVFKRISKVH